jgi:hypothetical protein
MRTLNNSDSLAIEARYLTTENREILRIAQNNGCLGIAHVFIKNGRSLQDFTDWLRAERMYDRAIYRRHSWFSPL